MPRGKPAQEELADAVRAAFVAGLSMRGAAAELGLTSGQVAGLWHRMNLKRGRAPAAPKPKRRYKGAAKLAEAKERSAKRVPERGAERNEPEKVEVVQPLSRISRRIDTLPSAPARGSCQWIEADPRVDPTKCGKPGYPYCPAHWARCHQPRGMAPDIEP